MSFPNNNRKKTILLICSAIILLSSAGSAIFFYGKYRQSLKSQQAITEIEQLVRQVSKLMELPTGETPTLATVSDKTKLQNQNFFQGAENGDRILVFSQAKKAILFRPSINKIIDVAPVVPLSEATPSPAPLAKVALYNASSTVGLTRRVEGKILGDEDLSLLLEVALKENANTKIKGNLVVDIAGNHGELSAKLAEFLEGTISNLPSGEATPTADIAVFLGDD